jgi:hypothetical protein
MSELAPNTQISECINRRTVCRACLSTVRDSTYSLAQRTALADGDPVTLLNTESRGDVSGQVLVALLVTVVLGDVVEVFTADDDGTVHLGRDDTAGKDTTTDGDLADEGALLVCSILAARSFCPDVSQG